MQHDPDDVTRWRCWWSCWPPWSTWPGGSLTAATPSTPQVGNHYWNNRPSFCLTFKGECREMFAPFFHDSNPSWTLIHIMKYFHMCEKNKAVFLHDLWMVLKVSMVEFFRQSHIRKCQSEAQTGWFNERDKIGGKISWCCPFNGLNPYWNGTGTSLDQITNYQPNLFYQTSDWNI